MLQILPYTPHLLFVLLAYAIYRIVDYIRVGRKLPPSPPVSFVRVLQAQSATDGMVAVKLKNELARWCEDNLSTTQDMSNGCVYRMPLPTSFPLIICCDYKFARTILAGSENIPEAEKPEMMNVLNAYPGIPSLLTYPTESKIRSKCRKVLAPVFSTQNLKATIYGTLKKQTCSVLDRFRRYAEEETVFDMCAVSVELIFEILTVTLFDLPLGEKVEGFDCYDFLHARNAYMKEAALEKFVPFRSLMFWSRQRREAQIGRAKVQKFGELLLERCTAHRKKMDSEEGGDDSGEGESDDLPPLGASGKTIISQMLRHKYPSAQHRVADMVTFIIAGYETTANTLSFFLYAMCINPQAKQKLMGLLDELPLNDEGLVGLSDITKLSYFDWCLRESIRLYTVNQFIARVGTVDLEHNGMVCPAGSLYYVTTPAIYRSHWVDRRDEFVPERWAPDAPQAARLKEMFIPFSQGLRGCLGQNFAMMELRVFAANFLRFYDFTLEEEPQIQCFVTMKPKDLMVRVTPRTTKTTEEIHNQ